MEGGSRHVEDYSSWFSLTFLAVSIEIIHTCKVTICADSLDMDPSVHSGFQKNILVKTLWSDKTIFYYL